MPKQKHLRLVSPDLDNSTLALPAPRPRRERGREPQRVEPLRNRWYPRCKYALDFILALVLALPALVIVAVSAVIVKLTSQGPAFYTQVRVGWRGRLFRIYKVRTMIHNCESLTGPRWSMPGDPRVTWFGRFLRISHLDELPQLLNVLRGEMSLIGPRPERPEFLPELERALPAFRQRLNVRPGVTGLAQVRLPADCTLDSVDRKLAHDLYYIRQLSPWLDLRLLLCTALYALGVSFDQTCRLLGIPDSQTVAEGVQDLLGELTPACAA